MGNNLSQQYTPPSFIVYNFSVNAILLLEYLRKNEYNVRCKYFYEEDFLMSENQNVETKKCKHCQSDIPKKAKVCPQCGKKQGGMLKWIIIAVVAIMIISAASGGEDEPKKVDNNPASVSTEVASTETEAVETVEYQAVELSDMIATLKANALKAEKTYQDMYVEVTGYLSNVDSDGDYISITATNDEWDFDSVQCYITNEEQIDVVLEKEVGDKVTIQGQITSIGEILGYSLDIEAIQ